MNLVLKYVRFDLASRIVIEFSEDEDVDEDIDRLKSFFNAFKSC